MLCINIIIIINVVVVVVVVFNVLVHARFMLLLLHNWGRKLKRVSQSEVTTEQTFY